MLTLRQIEVIRAVMIAGTVNGAAQMLNVSAPGVSRVMKYAEDQLGLRLFSRQHGRFLPTVEAAGIFDQIQELSTRMKNIQESAEAMRRGASSVFSFASVSSISQFVLPRAVRQLQQKHPDPRLKIDVIKIDEAIDYILLRKGELAAMSYILDHPSIDCQPLAPCSLVVVAPEGHPLTGKKAVTPEECLAYPMIGVGAAVARNRFGSAAAARGRLSRRRRFAPVKSRSGFLPAKAPPSSRSPFDRFPVLQALAPLYFLVRSIKSF